MDLYLHFIQINSEFNQALANDLHDGKETEDNIKCLWEDELKVSEDVKEFKIKNNTTYTLEGYFPDNKKFSFEIPDMTTCDCITGSGKKTQFAISKKLIKKTEKIVEAGKDETHLYFYLKDTLPMENPMNGIYIVKSDFPKELRSNN
jgi:polynucleotide 5'-kinase involved in rRNA processing